MLETILEPLIEVAIEKATETLAKQILEHNTRPLPEHSPRHEIRGRLTAQGNTTRAALQQHLSEVRRWSDVVSFSAMREKKSLKQVFVALDTYVMPLRQHATQREREFKAPLAAALLKTPDHIILLGQPGAGKSTAMQKICLDYFQSGKALLNYHFPIVVRLREIADASSATSIFEHIEHLLSIKVFIEAADKTSSLPATQVTAEMHQQAIITYLNSLRCLLILDGFDEIPSGEGRDHYFHEIRRLALGLQESRIIVTCRTADFPYHIPEAHAIEISPLTRQQVEEYAFRWLNDSEKSNDFVRRVFAGPYVDAALRPLTIAHLCAVYERVGAVPEKPVDVYKQIIGLLLEDWDSQRNIRRGSKYGDFHTQKKREFLGALSFLLTTRFRTSRFTSEMLAEAYRICCDHFGLPSKEVTRVLREVESHSGLVLESGYSSFEFAHKSLQEFLAAEHILAMPSLDYIEGVFHLLPNELAIATSMSTLPAAYLAGVVLNHAPSVGVPSEFYVVFIERLMLENPRFEQNDLATIAAIVLLIKCRDPRLYFNLFATLLSSCSIAQALEAKYYEKGRETPDSTEFRLRQGHSRFRLPQAIFVSSQLLNLYNRARDV